MTARKDGHLLKPKKAMKANDTILTPGIEITNPHIQRKRQRAKRWNYTPLPERNNDRKNTRSRKTQVIKMVDDSVWPPVMYTKHIKHPSK